MFCKNESFCYEFFDDGEVVIIDNINNITHILNSSASIALSIALDFKLNYDEKKKKFLSSFNCDVDIDNVSDFILEQFDIIIEDFQTKGILVRDL